MSKKRSKLDMIQGIDRDLDFPEVTEQNKHLLSLPNVKGTIIVFGTADTEKDFNKELFDKNKSWDVIPIKWEDDEPRYFAGIDPYQDEAGKLTELISVVTIRKRQKGFIEEFFKGNDTSTLKSRAILMDFLPDYLKWNGNTLPAVITRTVIDKILERL